MITTDLKLETLYLMQEDGILISSDTFHNYFEKVARKRATELGLPEPTGESVNIAGKKYNVRNGLIRVTEGLNTIEFSKLLGSGYPFIDDLEDISFSSDHGIYSHLIQYIARTEKHPDYPELHRKMGVLIDGKVYVYGRITSRLPLWSTVSDGMGKTVANYVHKYTCKELMLPCKEELEKMIR